MQHTQYSIGVITNLDTPPFQELKDTAWEYGVRLEKISPAHVTLSSFADSDFLHRLKQFDVIYYRTGLRNSALEEVAYHMRKAGIPVLNDGARHHALHKKIRQALIASRFNIPQPQTIWAQTIQFNEVADQLGVPFVVKPDEGSKGNAVALIESEKQLHDHLTQYHHKNFICQKYIEHATEYRVYTVNGKALASYKKQPGNNDFRANLHVGGEIRKTEPEMTKLLYPFAEKVSAAFGAEIAGIDILTHDNACLFLELNWQPGWRQVQELNGVNFPYETIQYALKKAHLSKPFYLRLLRSLF
ncbi:hypothetical protein CL655_03940 [bacterium]|nr:hypothetical protein [bacterium]|tara:strand:+ start:1981 stop:2883 length:903 start_codon:yes stop_codon:yes gene_type:complete